MALRVKARPFVGRTEELALLRELLARATAGEPLVVLLGGEAGVGKTRLAGQLAAAVGKDVRVLRGGCVPLGEEGLPFAPVVEALRGLARDLDPGELDAVAGPARADLARLVPDLTWDGEAIPGDSVAGTSQAGRGRLFGVLLGVVERLAAGGPVLWVMEDLHWADRSTRDLVAFLATALRSGRVLVLLTSAATSCTGCTRCAGCWASWPATAGCGGWSCRASAGPSWPSSRAGVRLCRGAAAARARPGVVGPGPRRRAARR
jgi:AAA ATPase domain